MKNKQLLKILIATAWIDGVIQGEERDYLRQVALREGLAEDAEIQPLLSGLKPVQATECYRWLEDYLGDAPAMADYQDLLAAISALIYSDGDVQTQEAKLLTKIQSLDPVNDSPRSALDKLVATIRKIYDKAITQS